MRQNDLALALVSLLADDARRPYPNYRVIGMLAACTKCGEQIMDDTHLIELVHQAETVDDFFARLAATAEETGHAVTIYRQGDR